MPLKIFISKHIYSILTCLLILVFFILRFSVLSFPFYWDEAWVYGPAVRILAEKGPSLLPGVLPVEYARGHPLLFHFLNAVWIKLTADTLFSIHLFNLLVSGALIFSTYYVGKQLFSPATGFWSAVVLCVQPIFIAQSSMVLPEVMLALFCTLAIYHFLKGNRVYYFIFASAALLTKETGIVVIMAVCVFATVQQGLKRKLLSREYLTILLWSLAPVLLFIVFLLIQYNVYGWVLFPEHAGFIVRDFPVFANRLTEGYAASLFIYDGRNFLFFVSIAVLILLLSLRKKVQFTETLVFLLSFIVLFLIVSSLNFFSNRYILSIIPAFILLTVGIIQQVVELRKIAILIFPLFIILQIPFLKHKSNTDHNPGYVNAIKTNMDIVGYLKSNKMQDSRIVAYFNTRFVLTNPYSGYVSRNEVFTHVTDEFKPGDYYIFSNYDSSEEYNKMLSRKDLQLVKRFEHEQAWSELYKRIN